jgi:hypothetical protein
MKIKKAVFKTAFFVYRLVLFFLQHIRRKSYLTISSGSIGYDGDHFVLSSQFAGTIKLNGYFTAATGFDRVAGPAFGRGAATRHLHIRNNQRFAASVGEFIGVLHLFSLRNVAKVMHLHFPFNHRPGSWFLLCECVLGKGSCCQQEEPL